MTATTRGNGNGNGATTKGERVAIVAGLRTPFAKQGTAYRDLSAYELGKLVVAELLQRAELDPKTVDMVVYGQVVPSLVAPNIAREIVLGTAMPAAVQAWSVSRACATSYQSLTSAAEAILAGQGTVAVTGGADSASDVPIAVSKKLARALVELQKARTLGERLALLARLRPKDLLPVPPALTEYSTGLSMGESAEKMAKENGISREAQDAFAHRSHVRAAAAFAEGRFAAEVMHVLPPPRYDQPLAEDNTLRRDSALEGYARLKPVFDRRYGSVTAGNSSPLTDGASALLVMAEGRARALGYTPLGYLRAWAYAALDPGGQLLMGPAYAIPRVLERAGLELSDLSLVDLHEAFAAAVLSQLQALASRSFAEEKLGRARPVGEVPEERLNVNGGSIAVGHPFAATGARQVTQTLHELKRRGGGLGLCAACAAGGLGAAVVLEVE